MDMKTEGARNLAFVLSEGNGSISRDVVTIVQGAGKLEPGTVLGRFTGGANEGKYTPSINVAADPDVGQQVAVAVLAYGVDATSDDAEAVVIARHAEVKIGMLFYHSSVDDATKRAAKVAQLAAVDIIAR